MFEVMALEVKMNEAFKVIDKNMTFLAEELGKSNRRIAELEKQVAILTDRVEFLYDEPLP